MFPSRPTSIGPILVALAALALPGAAPAADNVADPTFLERYAATYRFRLGHPTSIEPTPDGKAVLFLRSGPRSFVRELWALDVATGEERVLLTAGKLLAGEQEQLTAEEQARRERQRLVAKGIASFTLSEDGTKILVPLSGRLFVVERATGKVRELASDAGPAIDPQLSPDGTQVACVRAGELYVIDVAGGEERRLTSGAGGTVTHGLAEFVAQEEMSRHHGFWWSPDSRRIVYQRTDVAGLELMTIADATHPERAPERWPYPRPGMKNAEVRLGVIPVEGGETVWIDWDRETYEYLAQVTWQRGAPLAILVQNRRQTEQRLLAVDPGDGSTSTLLVERDEAWLDLDERMPEWLPDGSGFLWTTERGGAWQLELRDRDGSLRRALTPVEFGFRRFVRYLPGRREALVLAAADPTQVHAWRVALDSGRPAAQLSDGRGVHGLVSNRDGSLMVLTVARPSGPRRYEVIAGRADASRRLQLRSVAEHPGFEPELQFTIAGEAPGHHAVLIRPRNFDPAKRYPVIVHVYGGPTSQMVRADGGRYVLDQWIADHGYVVVSIDGRGTPGRGRDWQRAVRHDLIEVPLADQVAALRALGQRHPELDLERVGIYGWSFGGYFSAMAAMRRPDVFHAGVVGAPVVDWQDYDTHYTERYMDLPQHNPDGYAASNVLTWAGKLERPLLIIHGTADDNVYFVHSLKLVNALFREGKPFEFLPLAGFTHMVPDPLVTQRLYGRIMQFFEGHLRP